MKESKTKILGPQAFLDTSGVARKVAQFEKDERIYSQGDPATNVLYIQKGNVKFSVANASGKVAVVGMLGPTDFFGQGCMADQPVRIGTATALTPSTILSIEKNELLQMLHTQEALSDAFIVYMLGHNNRVEEDLIDHRLNSCEKRLARALLILGRYGKAQHQPDDELPIVSQGTLAEIIGTTRPRVNFFMNKFRNLGFIQYRSQRIKINKSLLNILLHD